MHLVLGRAHVRRFLDRPYPVPVAVQRLQAVRALVHERVVAVHALPDVLLPRVRVPRVLQVRVTLAVQLLVVDVPAELQELLLLLLAFAPALLPVFVILRRVIQRVD